MHLITLYKTCQRRLFQFIRLAFGWFIERISSKCRTYNIKEHNIRYIFQHHKYTIQNYNRICEMDYKTHGLRLSAMILDGYKTVLQHFRKHSSAAIFVPLSLDVLKAHIQISQWTASDSPHTARCTNGCPKPPLQKSILKMAGEMFVEALEN